MAAEIKEFTQKGLIANGSYWRIYDTHLNHVSKVATIIVRGFVDEAHADRHEFFAERTYQILGTEEYELYHRFYQNPALIDHKLSIDDNLRRIGYFALKEVVDPDLRLQLFAEARDV